MYIPILISAIALIVSIVSAYLQNIYSEAEYEYKRDPKFYISSALGIQLVPLENGDYETQINADEINVEIEEKNNLERLYFMSPQYEMVEILLDDNESPEDQIKKYMAKEYAKGDDFTSKDGNYSYFYRFIVYSSLDDKIEINILYNKRENVTEENNRNGMFSLMPVDKIKLFEFEHAHKDDPNYEGERIIAKKYRELEEYFKDYL